MCMCLRVCMHVCAAHISHQRLLFDDMYSQVGNCFVAAIILYMYVRGAPFKLSLTM